MRAEIEFNISELVIKGDMQPDLTFGSYTFAGPEANDQTTSVRGKYRARFSGNLDRTSSGRGANLRATEMAVIDSTKEGEVEFEFSFDGQVDISIFDDFDYESSESDGLLDDLQQTG